MLFTHLLIKEIQLCEHVNLQDVLCDRLQERLEIQLDARIV